jgi:hypothetical protein
MRTSSCGATGRWTSVLLLAVLALGLSACGLRGGAPEPPVVAPPTTPEPTPEPEPVPVTAEPVAVGVVEITYEALSNSVLIGRDPAPPDDAVLGAAVEGARAALERYLNTQFVDPATRFQAVGIQALLTPSALALLQTQPQYGLAQLDLALAALTTAPVSASATVLMDEAAVLSVLLRYDAVFHATLADGAAGPLQQQGALLFVPAEDGWRAEAVELALTLPVAGEPGTDGGQG